MCHALKRSMSAGACPSSNVSMPSAVAGTKSVDLAVPCFMWDSGTPSSPGWEGGDSSSSSEKCDVPPAKNSESCVKTDPQTKTVPSFPCQHWFRYGLPSRPMVSPLPCDHKSLRISPPTRRCHALPEFIKKHKPMRRSVRRRRASPRQPGGPWRSAWLVGQGPKRHLQECYLPESHTPEE